MIDTEPILEMTSDFEPSQLSGGGHGKSSHVTERWDLEETPSQHLAIAGLFHDPGINKIPHALTDSSNYILTQNGICITLITSRGLR